VIVGLAFAVAEPGQESEGYDDYTNPNAEFCLFLYCHFPAVPSVPLKNLILP